MNETITAIISGGAAVAIIEGVREYLTWRRNRKAAKEDKAEEKKEKAEDQARLDFEARLESIEEKTDAQSAVLQSQSEALKFMLYDRIRWLGQSYITKGEISFDDRRILNEMHQSYHNGLGGNGDLDYLMRDVNNLQLKKTR